MHKSFSFKGMGGSTDKLLAPEGECLELVNMRISNGSLRPLPKTMEIETLDTLFSKIYWHEQNSCYLCISDDSTSTISFYDSEWCLLLNSSGRKLKFTLLKGVRHVEFFGSIVCCMTDSGIMYLISDNGTYKWLGERPAFPGVSITITSQLKKLITETEFNIKAVVGEETAAWRLNEKGYIDECIFNLESSGHFIDRALFKYAIRLFDGSYIYTSQPFYVCNDNVIEEVGRDVCNLLSEPVVETSDKTAYRVKVQGFKPNFRFFGLSFSNWKGVIVGIDIFTTGSIKGKKVDTLNATFRDTSNKEFVNIKYEKYVDKSIVEIWNEVNDAALYYKYAEYNLDGKCIFTLDDVSMTNLLLQQSLASSEVAPDLTSKEVKCGYVLNNRLHIGGLREHFFKGYDAYSLLSPGGVKKVIEGFVIEVKIKTLNGVSRVVKDYGQIELGFKDGMFEIQPLLTYPDSRAYEMNLFAIMDTETFKKTVPLTPHKYLNMAQYLNKWYLTYDVTVEAVFASGESAAYISDEDVVKLFSYKVGTHKVVYSASSNSWTYNGSSFPPAEFKSLRIFNIRRDQADGDTLKFTIVFADTEVSGDFYDIRNMPIDSSWSLFSGQNPFYEEYPYEDKPNVMKVSSVENPFLFPAKSTYAPSQGEIVAVCNNAFELSQGKFGEHPLFVFCKDGIWAMAVDASGTVAYSASYPISKEICLNKDSVCDVGAGVIFVSERGVMLLRGNSMQHISEQMVNDAENSKIIAKSQSYRNILSMAGLSAVESDVTFLDFIRDCKAAYINSTNEVVFANPYFGFSFLFSLDIGTWSKIDEKAYGFVYDNISLKMFKHYGYETVIKDFGNFMHGGNKVALFTRPQLWGTKLPKRIMQLLLHAYVSLNYDYTGNVPALGCYLLCSNDGINFKLLKGGEVNVEKQDIAFRYFPTSSYRYYIIALAGNIGKESLITGVELEIALAWGNRLSN
ncbi:MAG: hypothetical protein J6U58_07505 [Bacteroidaceae bacterium]|nr:hypothetical protein [Bacteroidaceae bacterium]